MAFDHDQRFKTILKNFLPEFFELFFPEWAKQFEFDQTEWLDTEIFNDPPAGDRRVLDLVAKLKHLEPDDATQTDWLSLIHVEIESTNNVAPLRRRMHRYYADLRQRHNLPVLPVAVYLKVGLDGIGIDEYKEAFNSFEILHFRYLYVGLPQLDSIKYSQEKNILASAFAGLMKTPESQKPRRKAEAVEEISISNYNPLQQFSLFECLEAYFDLSKPQQQEFEQLLNTEEFQEAKQMAITTHEKGVEQGVEQGIEQGLEQGIEQTGRQLILQLLTEKFGSVTKTIIKQLDDWNGDYSILVTRILKAESIDDVDLVNGEQ